MSTRPSGVADAAIPAVVRLVHDQMTGVATLYRGSQGRPPGVGVELVLRHFARAADVVKRVVLILLVEKFIQPVLRRL